MAKSEIGQYFFPQFSRNRRTAELISGEHNLLLVSKLTFKFSLYLVQFIVLFTIGLNKQLNHPEVWSPIANNMAILFGSGFFVISFATIYNSKYWIHHLQFMGDWGEGGDFHVGDPSLNMSAPNLDHGRLGTLCSRSSSQHCSGLYVWHTLHFEM